MKKNKSESKSKLPPLKSELENIQKKLAKKQKKRTQDSPYGFEHDLPDISMMNQANSSEDKSVEDTAYGANAKERKKRSFWKPLALMLCLFSLLAGTTAGVGIGILNIYLDQLPTIPYLEDYSPWMPSRMFSGDEQNELIADFFNQRQNREMVPLAEMPKDLIDAVITLEDIRFYKHFGISPRAFIRAAYHDLRTGRREQGGSTITMQLAEDLILNDHLPYQLPQTGLKTFTQKIFEVLLALQIEKRYTKDEILEIYLNQVFLGGNIYGVANAAEFYFGKHISDLSLKECALFAGMLQRPNAYSPVRKPEQAQKRTEVVLKVMRREGVITQEEFDHAVTEPFEVRSRSVRRPQIARYPYFSSAVRRQFVSNKFDDFNGMPIELYGQGIDIHTTMDVALQEAAESSLREGIEKHERRRREFGGKNWGHSSYRWANYNSPNTLQAGGVYDAKAVSDFDEETGTIEVKLLNVNGGENPLPMKVDLQETWYDEFGLLKEGFFLRTLAVEEDGEIHLRVAEDQYVQGALIAVQPSTGKVLAMMGGYDYNDNTHGGQFNRAMQAVTVQPGSAFKPLLYTAALAAPDQNWTLASMVKDEKKEFWRGWTPRNFEGEYYGRVMLRNALIHSMNAASVWLLDNYMGSRSEGIQHLRNFCRYTFELPIDESNLSIALGTAGVTPIQLAQAYSVLANGGDFIPLHMVEKVYQRREAHRDTPTLLYEFDPPSYPVHRLSPENAYLTTHMLRGVVEEGTAQDATELPFWCVGKTGTTDDCVYAWFAGYTKDLLCIVYLGYDTFGQSLGRKMTGSKVALPVWMDFMQKAYETHPELFGEISPPSNIVFEDIDPKTGKLASENKKDTQRIPFIKGTEPTESSSESQDEFQHYQREVHEMLSSRMMD